MELRELRPGLWRWTAFHPEWGQEVGSVAYAADEDLVLIDPLLPSDDALDALVRWIGKPVTVLVTIFWHARSADLVARRHGARVLGPSGGKAAVRRRAPTMEAFRPGDALPGGVAAFATARGSEVVYWLGAHRAVVPGDVLLGDDGGRRAALPPELAAREHDARAPARVAPPPARAAGLAGARLARRAGDAERPRRARARALELARGARHSAPSAA